MFDVDASGARPTLTWKGCVPMPEGLAANSVASFADGSLVATVLIMPGKTFADSIAKRPTGAVYEWSPGDVGFTLMRGTELPANNGIETSADGREIYVASSGLQTIVAFSNSNPATQLRSTRPLPFTPDNVHMGADGRLLTAGMANDVAGVRRPAGTAARSREAVDVSAPVHRAIDRSRDDELHRDRGNARQPEIQQRDDGADGRRAILDRHILRRPNRARSGEALEIARLFYSSRRRFDRRASAESESGTSMRIIPSCRDVRNSSPSPLRLTCKSARAIEAPIVRSTRSRNVT